VFLRCTSLALAILCLALVACGGRGSGQAVPPSAPQSSAISTRVQFVHAATGTTIQVGALATVAVAPHLLAGDQLVSAARTQTAVTAPPNPAWSMLPGTLDVRFERPLRAARSMATGISITLAYPPEQSRAILNAQMPLTVVTYADGHSVPLGLPGDFDTSHDRVSVGVPQAMLDGAVDVKVGLAADNPLYTLPPAGPRYWTGRAWSRTGKIDPTKRTLVFIHGIFSSVETAFPDPCTPKILRAGGYQQALGWDYNWTNPPWIEGPKFTDFLNGLKRTGLQTFDLEAHSYGSVITYAALPNVTEKVSNVVTLGGPLPLRGTPLAKRSLLRIVLVVLAKVFVGPPSLINHAYKSGMVGSLATDGKAMRSILRGILGIKQKPDFVDVAGTKEYPEEYWLYPILYFYIEYPWDGIVEKIAANSKDIPNSFPDHFYKQHTELECAADVIAYVGRHVRPKPEALPARL
jgi:pimeloyl-ACP methyl ester carboxylesterase